jgi:hypothetical protein
MTLKHLVANLSVLKRGPRRLYSYPTPHVCEDPSSCRATERRMDRKSSSRGFQGGIFDSTVRRN